jgi:hypothetical protein
MARLARPRAEGQAPAVPTSHDPIASALFQNAADAVRALEEAPADAHNQERAGHALASLLSHVPQEGPAGSQTGWCE